MSRRSSFRLETAKTGSPEAVNFVAMKRARFGLASVALGATLFLGTILGTILSAGPALAGRSLVEPKAIQNLPRKMPSAQRLKALKAKDLDKVCTRSRLKTREIGGLQCRLALFSFQVKQMPRESDAHITALLDAARRAEAAAKSIAAYQPLTKKPGLVKDRYTTHKMACGVVSDVLTQLENLPTSATRQMKVTVARVRSGSGDAYNLTRASCDCTKATVGLANAAGVSLDERGALQGQLTSRGCLLNKSALDQKRGGPSGFTGTAAGVAAAASDVGRMLEYAKARDIGLNRCRTKFLKSAGKLSRPSKMKACVCNEISRWRFPKKRGRADLTFTIPVDGDALGVSVIVAATGKTKKCVKLVGKLVKLVK